ncbi:MAG: hypothetical protein JO329_01215 [Planctomycetaceae bacterium]|nr:hypothetical protein [Planctomycetaceae bacterium]MBV8268782.1 hypothetical protein [Planctomycetaceae bacterium]MBV8318987.1 hypothetical protein [Planctomycetaceae bacterium]MBV8606132.1 hypothetical protein [Singulisphaera sp.]
MSKCCGQPGLADRTVISGWGDALDAPCSSGMLGGSRPGLLANLAGRRNRPGVTPTSRIRAERIEQSEAEI